MNASAANTPASLAPDCEHWLNKFIDYLRYERGLSDHTIKNYARQLEQIALSLELASWQQLDQAAVKKPLPLPANKISALAALRCAYPHCAHSVNTCYAIRLSIVTR